MPAKKWLVGRKRFAAERGLAWPEFHDFIDKNKRRTMRQPERDGIALCHCAVTPSPGTK